MKTKYLDKRGWRRIIQSDYYETITTIDDEKLLIALIDMKKVRSPLLVNIVDKKVKVVDKDYKWLQIMPEKRPYSLTVMYDDQWNVLQYYFDVNKKHYLELGNARRKDLYLDVLALPDGRFELVDEADLRRAKRQHKISKKQVDEAYNTANHIMKKIKKNFSQFEFLAEECLVEIQQKM